MVQSPCAHFERPKLNVRVWSKKSLLIDKSPTEKMENLILKTISKKYRVQASSMSREGERGGAVFCKTQATSRIPLIISSSTHKTNRMHWPDGCENKEGFNKMQSKRERAFHC